MPELNIGSQVIEMPIKVFISQDYILHICILKEMLPDLVRHPAFLIFGTFLSNVQEDLFLRENKVSLNPIHRTHLYIYRVCDILIVLQANAMPLSTNNYIIIVKKLPSL